MLSADEWTLAVLRVVQATNVVLIYHRHSVECMPVRSLDSGLLKSGLGLPEKSLDSFERRSQNTSDDSLSSTAFLWSVLFHLNAAICPFGGCNRCVERWRGTKWATGLALIRSESDFPQSIDLLLQAGGYGALIHSHDAAVPKRLSTQAELQQSRLTERLVLSTFYRQSEDSSCDLLHEVIRSGNNSLFIW